VTLTTTITAMLAAVKRSPESMADDTLRLALADVLDETHPDEGGDGAWAELIRVQVDLARWKRDDARVSLSPSGITRHAELRRRSDALRAANEDRWRRGPACGRCGDAGYRRAIDGEHVGRPYCPDCAGSGWAGPLGAREPCGDARYGGQAGGASRWRVPADFRRGFIHKVSTPLADVFDGDTVTEWAVRVAQWPCVALEEWGLTDKEPGQGDLPRVFWQRQSVNHSLWAEHYVARRSYSVPDVVFDELPGVEDMVSRIKAFDTPAAARHALARAVAATVNEAAHD
jgi:uncharacterized protein (TIGR02996 family)